MAQIPFDAYLAIKAINWTVLKCMALSPKHYAWALEHPREDTTPLIKGRATHTAVFEPDRFPVEYSVFKGKTRRGAAWDAFKEMHAEDSILKLDEYETCLDIRNAVRSHPVAAQILAKGQAEQAIEWVDPVTQLRCKARLDFVSDARLIADLKGVRMCDGDFVGRLSARMGYHRQLAFYRKGYQVATGRRLDAAIIAAEITPPHDVAVFRLTEDDLELGWEACQQLLIAVAECTKEDRWPGAYEDEQLLSLPAWVFPDEDQVMSTRVLDEAEMST